MVVVVMVVAKGSGKIARTDKGKERSKGRVTTSPLKEGRTPISPLRKMKEGRKVNEGRQMKEGR